ncbi:MAG: diacylglycerol kinase family protein [Akkermansia sp.]
MQKRFSLRARARSFGYAFQGLATLLREEPNARIHLFFAMLAIALGLLLQIATMEWLLIILCIGIVFATEALNTAIEAICDRVTTNHDPFIKKAKDCGAAATFLVAMGSALIGVLIFIPKLWAMVV